MILVDDYDGSVHRAYGLMPNATFVLARGGIVLYKAMWTSAGRLQEFLERCRALPAGVGHVPFYTEQVELRARDAETFVRALERNGPRAVSEFARVEEIWAGRARAAARSRRAG